MSHWLMLLGYQVAQNKKQWNLWNVDNYGVEIFVFFRQVSTFKRLYLWDFDQRVYIFGLKVPL